MQPLFLGGHPAIDFLNTSFAPDGAPVETIGDGRALLAWMVSAKLLEPEETARLSRRLGARALDQAAADARKLREKARAWLLRWRVGDRRWREGLAGLNQALSGATYRRAVIEMDEGVAVSERPQLDGADALTALLARTIADLVTQQQGGLVKSCAGAGCTLWFLDRTKTHGRLFCSATACGNRAKVAAFRKRKRASG
jgi:predicted RNA-binding Zn ribbon-like protein